MTENRLWVERLSLTNFRNYETASLNLGPEPVVLAGANGSGKTNILEAVSLLAAGQGLRGSPFPDLARAGGDGSWSVAARVHTEMGAVDIGTGLQSTQSSERTGRIVRIDGEAKTGSGVLADYVEMVWVTPATDGLFTGAATDRRRFLDRLILCFDPAHRTRAGKFERAMSQRNRLLSDGITAGPQIDSLEIIMAEMGIAFAAARAEAVAALAGVIETAKSAIPKAPSRGAASPSRAISIVISHFARLSMWKTPTLPAFAKSANAIAQPAAHSTGPIAPIFWSLMDPRRCLRNSAPRASRNRCF